MTGFLLVSADDLVVLWSQEGETRRRVCPFAVTGVRASDGGVEVVAGTQAGEEVRTVPRIGNLLSTHGSSELVEQLTRACLLSLLLELPDSVQEHPIHVLVPPWMGPGTRRRLCEIGRDAGFELEEGTERGSTLASAYLSEIEDAIHGRLLVADRCGDDLDLYRFEASGEDLRLVLLDYRRCQGAFGCRRDDRGALPVEELSGPLSGLEDDVRRLIVSDAAVAEALSALLPDATLAVFPWERARSAMMGKPVWPKISIERRLRFWISTDGEWLDPLFDAEDAGEHKELLFLLPQPPPPQLSCEVRVGFGRSFQATYGVLSIRLQRPRDYRALEGFLLVRARRTARSGGEIALEIVQESRSTYRHTYEFSLQEAIR